MRPSLRFLVLALIVLMAGGCATAAAPAAMLEEPAHVEPVDGDGSLHRITLTARAAERLGIELVPAEPAAGGLLVVPYSAVIYDAAGQAWIYVTDGDPLTFVRAPVEIERVEPDDAGGTAHLRRGPAAGAQVVSVGVAELFGTEFEVGH